MAATLHTNYVSKLGTTFETFDTLGDFTPFGNGSLAAETSDVKEGSACLKVLSPSNSDNQQAIKTISKVFTNVNTFRMWVKPTANCTIVLGFSSETTFGSKYMNATLSTSTLRAGYWNLIRFDKDDFTAVGGEDWANTMIRMRVRCVSGSASVAAYCLFDELTLDMGIRPKCIISFDSAVSSIYTKCFPIMSALGIRGTLYTQSALVNNGSSGLTTAQLTALQNAGWDICSHSVTHPNFTSLTDAQIRAEADNSQKLLKSLGFIKASRHFAYPEGGTNDNVISILSEYYDTARITTDTITLIPIPDPYRIECLTMKAVDATTIATDLIDDAIEEGKLAFLMFESVADSNPAEQEYLTSDFKIVMQYLAARSAQIDATTITEFMRGLDGGRKLA